jgi:PAS domain S-box-containing protein
MTSYLGFPITWPNGDVFGTICVLDNKRNEYSDLYQKLLLHCRDVLETDLRNAASLAEERTTSKAHLDELFDQSPEGIVLLDTQDRVLRINPEFTRMFGYTPEEAIGRFVNDLIAPEELRSEAETFTQRITDGESLNAETIRRRKDGKRVPVSLLAVPISNPGGQVAEYAIYRDITERKRAEEALSGMTRKLVEAQEQERSRIGRELHDDVGQRVIMLSIALDQLKDQNNLPPEVRDQMQELKQMASDISTGIHALSHELNSSTMEYLGLVSGMRGWCEEYGKQHKLEIDFKSDDVPPLPQEISLCLFRVLQEALHNAAKYSGVKRIEVQLAERSGEIHLIVSDSGKGFDIEAARQKRGLGLTSMRERVRLVGGTLVIDSKPSAGTTIYVSAPFQGRRLSAAG